MGNIDALCTRSGKCYFRYVLHDPANQNLPTIKRRKDFEPAYDVDKRINQTLEALSSDVVVPVPKKYESAVPSLPKLLKCYPAYFELLMGMFRNQKRDMPCDGWFDFLYSVAVHHGRCSGRRQRRGEEAANNDNDDTPQYNETMKTAMENWFNWYNKRGKAFESDATTCPLAFFSAVEKTLDIMEAHWEYHEEVGCDSSGN